MEEAPLDDSTEANPPGDDLQLPYWQSGVSAGRDAIRLYDVVVGALRAVQPKDPSVQQILDELRRQRRVMVATPLPGGAAPYCAAAIDVLMPSPDGAGYGVRLMGDLSWAQIPADGDDRWTLATVVKTQAHGQLRHLSSIGPEGTTRRVAVRLGTLGPAPAMAAQACLRVRDVTRLWLALGAQWSFRLLLATQPLVLSLTAPSSNDEGDDKEEGAPGVS